MAFATESALDAVRILCQQADVLGDLSSLSSKQRSIAASVGEDWHGSERDCCYPSPTCLMQKDRWAADAKKLHLNTDHFYINYHLNFSKVRQYWEAISAPQSCANLTSDFLVVTA